MNKDFIFLVHNDVVVPQSLEDSDAGEIIRALLKQGFYIPPFRICAEDSTQAFRQFQQSSSGKSNGQEMRGC